MRVDVEHSGLRMVLVDRESIRLLDASWKAIGIYFLLGPGDDPRRFKGYVGEVGKSTLVQRVRQHALSKDWWSRVLLVTKDGESFNSAEIGWLEGRLYDLLSEAVACQVMNGNRPVDNSLSPERQRLLETRYIEPIMAALRACGAPLDPPPSADVKRQPKRVTGGSVATVRNGRQHPPAPGATPFDWSVVERLVAAIPRGRWASYGDVAACAGTGPRVIGQWAGSASTAAANAYRVLNASGELNPGFHWDDPNDTTNPRELLRREGVRFDDAGRASPADRISGAELQKLVSPMPATVRAAAAIVAAVGAAAAAVAGSGPDGKPSEPHEAAVAETPDSQPAVCGQLVLLVRGAGLPFPLPIHGVYRGTRMDAAIREDGSVHFAGTSFASLSAAAIAAQLAAGRSQKAVVTVNGWAWWRFTGPDGVVRPLAGLRVSR